MRVLEIYDKKLRFKGYSERTIETYTCYFKKYLHEEDIKDPYQVTLKDIEIYLINKKYSSKSQQNQIIGSLKFFAKYVLGKKDIHLDKIERPRKDKKIPLVIDSDKLRSIINGVDNLKHKAILMLGYSCALRVSEVINLKMKDIDSDRMVINIRNAKGGKDRVVVLSDNLLEALREYYIKHKPIEHLFNGQFSNKYSASSCNKIVKKYCGNDFHYHTLRHSGATTMLESGVDIHIIQKLLGHNSVKTTTNYLHISRVHLNKVATPM